MVSRIELGRNVGLTATEVPKEATKLGKMKNLSVYWEKDFDEVTVYLANENKKVIANLELGKFPGKRSAWIVEMSAVSQKYQGFGIMPMLYRFLLLNVPNFILQAGTVQSPGGRAIWNALAKFPDIMVFTMQGNEPVELKPDQDTGEVSGDHEDLDIYSDYEDSTRVYAKKR